MLRPAPAIAGFVSWVRRRSGGTSSLTIVTVAPPEPRMYDGSGVIATTTVSLGSATTSSMGVTTIVADASPAAIVTLPLRAT